MASPVETLLPLYHCSLFHTGIFTLATAPERKGAEIILDQTPYESPGGEKK